MASSEWILRAFDPKICSVLTSSVMETRPEEWNEIVRATSFLHGIHEGNINISSLFQVLELCKYLLLYTCSPAALVRLTKTPLSGDFNHLCDLYKRQHHISISDFLKYHIDSCCHSKLKTGLLMQVLVHHSIIMFKWTMLQV